MKGPEECPKDLETAYIELVWNVDEHDWTLGLSFEAMENDYTVVLVNGSYSEGKKYLAHLVMLRG